MPVDCSFVICDLTQSNEKLPTRPPQMPPTVVSASYVYATPSTLSAHIHHVNYSQKPSLAYPALISLSS